MYYILWKCIITLDMIFFLQEKSSRKRSKNICLAYICCKMLSSPLDTMLTLSKTTYPPKFFSSDCITLHKKSLLLLFFTFSISIFNHYICSNPWCTHFKMYNFSVTYFEFRIAMLCENWVQSFFPSFIWWIESIW